MNTVTLQERVCQAAAEDHCNLGPNLCQLVRKAVWVGWQFRWVFSTHIGEWSHVMDCPRKIRTGDPGPKGVTFEVRDVYAFAEEDQPCQPTTTTNS